MSVLTIPSRGRGDEGMYLFNDLPQDLLQQRHQFTPTDPWVRDLQLSSVRFNSGGSGSFISSTGLVLTNHHVASDTLAKLSTPERNLIEDGFLARTRDDEIKAPDLELNQLIEIIDVTDQVNDAVAKNASAEDAAKQRRAVIARIEGRSYDSTGLRSDVVTLFGGAQFHLYRYKKYTDVRLVWAPETAAAFFGGDADNFEYPRYNLDATIMRVYENDAPAKLTNFLHWSDRPVADGDLVFVSGHPGRTQRIFTVEALEYLRDERLPYMLDLLRRKEILLQQYGLESQEAARRGRDDLFGIQNSRKAYTGMLAGLQNPQTISAKRSDQARLQTAVNADPALSHLADAWDTIAQVQTEKAAQLGRSVNLRSGVFALALKLVLLAQEDLTANEDRLAEFTDASRESLLAKLLSPAPLYEDLERVLLADEIAWMLEHRGFDDPLAAHVIDGRSPRDVAADLVNGTKLTEIAARQALIDGGLPAIKASTDPMIELARRIEPEYRRLRDIDETLAEREKQAYAKIAEAISEVDGTGGYPDATFTLRLAFGIVRGYQEDGQSIRPFTTIAGAYQHAADHVGQDDFQLPVSWTQNRDAVDLSTQLNFVCTADIIGGNSGSPVVDRNGQLVGLIFDGNIQSLTSDYLYTDEQGRAVSVSGVGILESLRSIYNAGSLADEIGR